MEEKEEIIQKIKEELKDEEEKSRKIYEIKNKECIKRKRRQIKINGERVNEKYRQK